MMKKIVIVVGIVVVVFVATVASRPPTFHIERSIVINAPPETVHRLINDLHHRSEWSPWEKLDASMTRTFSGPAAGVGAEYEWKGSDRVGEGKMRITSSTPEQVVTNVEFVKPWKSVSTATFLIVPQPNQTRVTWSLDGTSNFMGKLVSMFKSMDDLIGPDYERGLSNMKSMAETNAKAAQPSSG